MKTKRIIPRKLNPTIRTQKETPFWGILVNKWLILYTMSFTEDKAEESSKLRQLKAMHEPELNPREQKINNIYVSTKRMECLKYI